MDLVIREIAHGSADYWMTVALREEILRRPLGLRFTSVELEKESSSTHLAACCGERIVGCLILRPLLEGVVQMRQVAVDAAMQRRGIGAALVEYAEQFARQRGFVRMVLHARETAVGFYEQRGYLRGGLPFEEVTLPHWEMEKQLSDKSS